MMDNDKPRDRYDHTKCCGFKLKDPDTFGSTVYEFIEDVQDRMYDILVFINPFGLGILGGTLGILITLVIVGIL
jgi:hypothetical protein